MKESKLLKIAIIGSLIGIIILSYISEKSSLNNSNIREITDKTINEKVKIKGYITSLAESSGLYIITVKDDTGSIRVVVFKEEKINISKSDLIEVEGKITKYKEETEVVADIIRLIK
ncbi:MAG: OB-fold nucleic acid binding domain-containing protein [Nanoarchaeota archaeon]